MSMIDENMKNIIHSIGTMLALLSPKLSQSMAKGFMQGLWVMAMEKFNKQQLSPKQGKALVSEICQEVSRVSPKDFFDEINVVEKNNQIAMHYELNPSFAGVPSKTTKMKGVFTRSHGSTVFMSGNENYTLNELMPKGIKFDEEVNLTVSIAAERS